MKSKRAVSRCTRFAVAITCCLALAGTGWGATYPTPPADFSHPGSFHDTFARPNDPVYSHLGGQIDRPMLVIYARWDDVDFPPAFNAARVASRFFGSFPSVADYFLRTSFGELELSPAPETEGVWDDGVVQVHVPGTKAEFFTLSEAARNKVLVQAADPFVDFRAFDANGNRALSDLELVLNTLEANPLPPGAGLGIANPIAPVTLDGVALGGLWAAMTGTHTALITIIHENGHAALHMDDLYIYGVGKLDFAGPGGSEGEFYGPSAWQKMHWGWIVPTVVVRDGYYDMDSADLTRDAFILYDPDRGTDDYFIVENRLNTLGTYDSGVPDSGLVIWRIDDAAYNSRNTAVRPIELMRPNGTTTPEGYGGSENDAWDPSDPDTTQRTMTRTWRNGSDSRVAVRAIGDGRRETIRAYFDVRGPGILVDPYRFDHSETVWLTPAALNTIDVPVMNTGEGRDGFSFQLIDLPPGWTTQGAGRILEAGQEDVARVRLTPDAAAAPGLYRIGVRGRSFADPSVTSMASFRVVVVLHNTKVSVIGATMAPTGAAVTLRSALADEDDGFSPVEGAAVTFKLAGKGGEQTAKATTDRSGIAEARIVLSVPPGDYTLTVESARQGKHAPGSTSVPFTVEPRR